MTALRLVFLILLSAAAPICAQTTVPQAGGFQNAPDQGIRFTFSDATSDSAQVQQVAQWQASPIRYAPHQDSPDPAMRPQVRVQSNGSDAMARPELADREREDDSPLPRVANVTDPINATPLGQLPQHDPLGLLTNLPSDRTSIFTDATTYAGMTKTPSAPAVAYWEPPNFAHRPLLFEQPNLERYGNQVRAQNVASGLHFFGTIPALPYKIGQQGRHLQSTLGRQRPGNCVPSRVQRFSPSLKGGVLQAIVTTAVIVP